MNTLFLIVGKEYDFGGNRVVVTDNLSQFWRVIVLESKEIPIGDQIIGLHSFQKTIKEL
jgi:hypothetical protein